VLSSTSISRLLRPIAELTVTVRETTRLAALLTERRASSVA
jgi:hypothetical protein